MSFVPTQNVEMQFQLVFYVSSSRCIVFVTVLCRLCIRPFKPNHCAVKYTDRVTEVHSGISLWYLDWVGSLYANRIIMYYCITVLRAASGPRVKLAGRKSALATPTPVGLFYWPF